MVASPPSQPTLQPDLAPFLGILGRRFLGGLVIHCGAMRVMSALIPGRAPRAPVMLSLCFERFNQWPAVFNGRRDKRG